MRRHDQSPCDVDGSGRAEAKAGNVVSNVLRRLTMKRSSEEEERNLTASFDPSNVSAVELQTVRLIAGGRVWTGQEVPIEPVAGRD